MIDSPITAAMLYDYIHCPHRVAMDRFGDPQRRDAVSDFVQLLWRAGTDYERAVIEALETPYVDLSGYHGDEKECRTAQAMSEGASLIYSPRLSADSLLGEPDLLRRTDAGYEPGDIKSGSGEQGGDHARPKRHYAVQLALYVDLLQRRGWSPDRRGFIWDVHGREIVYELDARQSQRSAKTYWDDYCEVLEAVTAIAERRSETLPAYGGVCKLCHWYSACKADLHASGDLSLIPELGRAARDALRPRCGTLKGFAAADVERFIRGDKTELAGVGAERLRRFHKRARLLTTPGAEPYLREPLNLPHAREELFFDIEVDPMRDHCYLHGFVERRDRDNGTERFVAFFADDATREAERRAFADAMAYLRERPDAVVYYYSAYERTIWRKLQQRHPQVASPEEIEAVFAPERAVDLYAVVRKQSEWPTNDHSIKTLATYLGFRWRDDNPSGAASIEWFHRWTEDAEPAVKQRILAYNEDDCRAMRVLKDALVELPVDSR